MRNQIVKKILDRTPLETKIFMKHYAAIVKRIHDLIEEKGITQKELAEKMGKTPSEINRWLNNDHNLTLKTIAKLEAAIGESIIEIYNPQESLELKISFSMRVIPMHKTDQDDKRGNFIPLSNDSLKRQLENASYI